MKSTLLVSIALASTFCASVSAAADAATPPVIAYASLPTGALPRPPAAKSAPAAIPSHERVPGVFMAAMPKHQAVVIAGTREGTDRFTGRARPSAGDDEKSREICLSQSTASRQSDEARAAWEPNLQPAILTMTGSYAARVNAVHVERVVDEGDDRAALEITDAWVDLKSQGARLIGRAKLPLKLVARAPGDIRVYAMRGKDSVQVVLVEPSTTARTWQGIVQTGDQGTSTSGCRHARAELALERGSGETSTFVVTAELPATAADKELVAESASGSAGLEAVRTRPMHVHASASWASREAEPVLAVSAGWAARDRATTVFRSERANVANFTNIAKVAKASKK